MDFKLLKIVAIFLLSVSLFAQTDKLKTDIDNVLANKKAIVGIAIANSDGTESIGINNTTHFPMQSVFKFHIAIVILSEIDNGHLDFEQKVTISKSDLLPHTWSPLRDGHPNGGIFSLAQILEFTLKQSDNIGCDVLLRILGGTQFVEDYFRKKGINNVAVKANEEKMHNDSTAQFTNWTTPAEANTILKAYYINKDEKLLSKKSHAFLWDTIKSTVSAPNRIKAQLPKNTVVAHRTGTSGINDKGIAEATNDIGIVFLPNGNCFYISVFVAHSKEDEATNEKIIADVTKLVYDYYNKL